MKFVRGKHKDIIDVSFDVVNDVLDILSRISPRRDLPKKE